MCGNKIKNIIDITNNRTRIIKRSDVLSIAMYVLANCITLVAIVRTVDIKIMLVGSKRIGMEMSVLYMGSMFHSIKMVVELNVTIIVIMYDRIVKSKSSCVVIWTMIRII